MADEAVLQQSLEFLACILLSFDHFDLFHQWILYDFVVSKSIQTDENPRKTYWNPKILDNSSIAEKAA